MLDTILTKAGLKKDGAWVRFLANWMILSFALHLMSAVSSLGFFHADEHFKILEFLNYKMGRTPALDLPVEFHFHLVPWLLPAFFTLIAKVSVAFGVDDPFQWALSFRFFAATLGWLATLGLALSVNTWIQDRNWRRWAVILLSIAWYLPSLHSRHSAETIGASFFFIGLSVLTLSYRPGELPRAAAAIAGVFFGLAVESHYEMVLMVLPVLLWMALIARSPLRSFGTLAMGFFSIALVGALTDCWGYSAWVFVPWNAFRYSVLERHLLAGTPSPWWNYLRISFTDTLPVLGTIALVGTILAWIRHPKNPLTWALAPLFVFHAFLPHKELRDLYPLAMVAPISVILAMYSSGKWTIDFKKFAAQKAFAWPMRALIGANAVALIYVSVTPAWMPARFYASLYHFRPFGMEIFFKGDSPFALQGENMYYYRPQSLVLTGMRDYSELAHRMEQTESEQFLFQKTGTLPKDAGPLQKWCKPQVSMLPDGIRKLAWLPGLSRLGDWTLYRCQKAGDTTIRASLLDLRHPSSSWDGEPERKPASKSEDDSPADSQ